MSKLWAYTTGQVQLEFCRSTTITSVLSTQWYWLPLIGLPAIPLSTQEALPKEATCLWKNQLQEHNSNPIFSYWLSFAKSRTKTERLVRPPDLSELKEH
jgi:hypothetical protein